MTYWQPTPKRPRSRFHRAGLVVLVAVLAAVACSIASLILEGPSLSHHLLGAGASCRPGSATTLVSRGDATFVMPACVTEMSFGGTWISRAATAVGLVMAALAAGATLQPWRRGDPQR